MSKMRKSFHILYFAPFMVGAFNAPSFASDTTSPSLTQWRMGVGVATEYASHEINLKIEPQENGSKSNISSDHQQIIKKIQLAPTIECGASFRDAYYLGVQLSWRKSNAQGRSKNSIRLYDYRFVNEFKIDSYTNILMKPGYKITPQFMVYGLVGPSIATWSHTTQLLSDRGPAKKIERDNVFTAKSKSIGIGLGLGIECLARQNYALSFDYTYHFHRSKTENHKVTLIETEMDTEDDGTPQYWNTPHPINITKKIQPSYSTFAVRLTYFFNFG